MSAFVDKMLWAPVMLLVLLFWTVEVDAQPNITVEEGEEQVRDDCPVPSSFREGALEEALEEAGLDDDNPFACIYLERTGVVPDAPVTIDIAQQGAYFDAPDENATQWVPPDASSGLDSMLIHFDPPGDDDVYRVEFQLRFDRPIVGIIYRSQTLEKDNIYFGREGIDYATGGGSELQNLDSLSFFGERRVIAVELVAREGIDQIRLLFSANDEIASETLNESFDDPDPTELQEEIDAAARALTSDPNITIRGGGGCDITGGSGAPWPIAIILFVLGFCNRAKLSRAV